MGSRKPDSPKLLAKRRRAGRIAAQHARDTRGGNGVPIRKSLGLYKRGMDPKDLQTK